MRMRIISRIILRIKLRARVRPTEAGTPHPRKPISRDLRRRVRGLARVVRRVAAMSPRRSMRMRRGRCRHIHGCARRGGIVPIRRVVWINGHGVAGTGNGRRAGTTLLPVFLGTERRGGGHIAVEGVRGLGLLLAAALFQELLDGCLLVLVDLDYLLAKTVG